MRRFPSAVALVLPCTTALAALAADPTHRAVVMMTGGAEAVTECMRLHRSHERLQAEACALLNVIAFDDSVKTDLVETGAVAAATEALVAHPHVCAVCAPMQAALCCGGVWYVERVK